MKKGHVAVLIIAMTAITWFAVARMLTTSRGRVVRVVQSICRRIEKRDAAGLCLHLTEDYRDSNGHNRSSLRGLLSRALPYFSSISVTAEELDIRIPEGDAAGVNGKATAPIATAEFDVKLVAYPRQRPKQPPWRAQSRVRLRLRKDDGEWRVNEAEYRMPNWRP